MLKKTFVVFFIVSIFLALKPPSVFAAPKNEIPPDIAAFEKVDNKRDESTSYVIGPQNLLQIKVFGEADINQTYRVDEDGYIKHALAGRVKVGGLTISQVEKEMEKRLDGDYVINPQINVFVIEYSHFSIIGEVRKPGNYEITGRISVIRALSMAGGFTPIANQRAVQIIRKNPNGTESKIGVDATRILQGDLSADVDLQADDVIVIPKSFF